MSPRRSYSKKNGFSANANACSSTHRQEIGGGYFVFFIVFFRIFFFISSIHLRRSTGESRKKCMRQRCGTCKFRCCCCLFSFQFFSFCSAMTHGGNSHRLAEGPPHLVNCYRVRVVECLHSGASDRANRMELLFSMRCASELDVCVFETSDEITWIQTSELKQKLLKMYAFRCMRVCVSWYPDGGVH